MILHIPSISFGLYKVENDGVLIYISDSSPTADQQKIIEQWKNVHFIDLRYDGPEKYMYQIERILNSCGVFNGGKEPFFIKVYEGFGHIAIWMWKEGKSWDNFLSPVAETDIDVAVKDGVRNFFSCKPVPEKSFLVYLSEGSITSQVIDFNGSPLTLKREEKEFYEVLVDDEATSMKTGFHKINSHLVYIGKEKQKISTVLFFENANMVYPVENEFAVLRGSILTFPDGKKVTVETEPVYVGKNLIIYRNSIEVNGKTRDVKSTILDSNGRVVIEADGTVEDVEGKWKMKISGTPIEWYFKSNLLYVLDIYGFVKEFDTISKKTLFEKRYSGAYGFDFVNKNIVVGIPDKVLFNEKKLDMNNFCVAKNHIWEYKNCKRLHNGIGYIVEDGKIKLIGKNMEFFANKIRLIDGWLIIAGEEGTWAVKAGN